MALRPRLVRGNLCQGRLPGVPGRAFGVFHGGRDDRAFGQQQQLPGRLVGLGQPGGFCMLLDMGLQHALVVG